MSAKLSRRKCRNCNKFFRPDYRNNYHQHYCSAAVCQQASKRASQRRWLHKTANHDCFRGPTEVQRVQRWRKDHPGYWKTARPVSQQTQVAEGKPVNHEQRSRNVPGSDLSTLQDLWLIQHPAFVGLISMVTGSTLQEDIETTARQVLLRGQAIQGLKIQGSAAPNEKKTDSTRSSAPGSSGLQLGGPPPSPP